MVINHLLAGMILQASVAFLSRHLSPQKLTERLLSQNSVETTISMPLARSWGSAASLVMTSRELVRKGPHEEITRNERAKAARMQRQREGERSVQHEQYDHLPVLLGARRSPAEGQPEAPMEKNSERF